MSVRINWKNLVLYVLILLHALWIANHMRLVYQDRINPWRLGGYGMYTVPPIRPQYVVVDLSEPAQPKVLNNKDLNFKEMANATRFTNIGRAFRCKHIPEAALIKFFESNLNLINKSIIINILDNKFERKDPWISFRAQGRVEIKWLSSTTITYDSLFCDVDAKTGIVSLQ